jgi:hypothetical protein
VQQLQNSITELLRLHDERIEAWILEQAAIVFDAKAAPGGLRVVDAPRAVAV